MCYVFPVHRLDHAYDGMVLGVNHRKTTSFSCIAIVASLNINAMVLFINNSHRVPFIKNDENFMFQMGWMIPICMYKYVYVSVYIYIVCS